MLLRNIPKHVKNLFLNYVFVKKPKVYSFKKTIDLIKEGFSISRFGDGELGCMVGNRDIGTFQKYTDDLKRDLLTAFNDRSKKMLICMTDSFNKLFRFKGCVIFYYLSFGSLFYKNIYRILDKKYIYGNTNVTRFYMDRNIFFKPSKRYVDSLIDIWASKTILVIEGNMTKLGVGNNLFDKCKSIRRIVCPSKNAYSVKDNIIKSFTHNYCGEDLVILALGPTASILSVYLHKKYNVQCLDLGHVDIEYMWYLSNAKNKSPVIGKDWADNTELNKKQTDAAQEVVCDDDYLSQIIDRVELR